MIAASVTREIKKKLPIFDRCMEYNVPDAICDLIAGVTVGLTLIPQAIAYASLAGLEPQYGLYSSLCGGFVYAVFGTIAEINIAPTAIVSLLIFSATDDLSYDRVYGVVLLCFLSGLIELLCGIFKFGFLLDFVSVPVVSAFTTAAAITVASSQLKHLLGLKFSASSVVSVWKNVFIHISETKWADAVLSLACCLVLVSLRKLKDYGRAPITKKSATNGGSGFKIVLWFVCVARNALVVICCAFIAFILLQNNRRPFSLTSHVAAGWPTIGPPSFSITKNDTSVLNFFDLLKELKSGVVVVPFVSILSNVAIARGFSKGRLVDASQEMIALGMCNLIGSFFSSYPVNSGFARSAVFSASGVRTPLAGIYTGIIVILACQFLTPYFSYIPKATLAAVILCAVLFMVELTIVQHLWKINKYELIPFAVTIISALFFGLEIGILSGISVDIIKLLYISLRPNIITERINTRNGYLYSKITPTADFLFSSTEFFREQVLKATNDDVVIVIDCHRISRIDYTSIKGLESLLNDLSSKNQFMVLYHVNNCIEKLFSKLSINKISIMNTVEELESFVDDLTQMTR